MKKIKFIYAFAFVAILLSVTSCNKDDDSGNDVEVNYSSIVPYQTAGRTNIVQGCVEIYNRMTTIQVWDHGLIDGDIVSVYANGERIINERTLDGPDNKISVDYDFGYNGFNELTLYAHNLGDIPPNTAAISINGVEFVLEANLDANGSFDIVVAGYGVTCDDSNTGGGSGGGTGGGNQPDSGDIAFWTGQNLNCGNVSVTLSGVGSGTITQYFPSGTPDCGDAGTLTFYDVPHGTYSYTASCGDYSWSGSIDFYHSCYTMKLTL